MSEVDVVILGAGPAGLGAAIELQRRGQRCLLLDRGGIAESIRRYPPGMVFFTTRERIEIGGYPLTIPETKPTREQALAYYRQVALSEQLPFRTHEEVTGLEGTDGAFEVHSCSKSGRARTTRCKKVVVATGTFQRYNPLGVPGEDLDKVSHFYTEGHPFAGCQVMVVGAANSAAEAALDLFRCGARVRLVYRGKELDPGLKYWVGPDLLNRIREGSIVAHRETVIDRITPESVWLRSADGGKDGGNSEYANDFVFAMTGFRPDPSLLELLGLGWEADTLAPLHDPHTFESSRPGVHVIGSLVAGKISGRVFIENGRHHGEQLATYLAGDRTAS